MGTAETGPVRSGASRAPEAGSVGTGASRGGAAAVTVPVVLVGSAFATSALTLHARELAAALVATMPLRSADLPDVVALALVLVGAAVAGWYLLSALTAAALLLARGGGGTTTRLQAWLTRWGAPALRRAFATTAVASMGLGVAVSTSAMAASTDGPSTTVEAPSPSAEQGDPVPADLGWGAPTPSERPDEHVPAPPSTAAVPAGTPGAPSGSTPRATSAAAATGAAPRKSDPGRPDQLAGPAPTSAPRPDEARGATTETPSVGSPLPPDPTAPSAGAPVARTASAPPATPGAPTSADRAPSPSVPGPVDTSGSEVTRDGEAAHLVRAGESLWSVAAGHLGSGASDADVADAWPRWYRENVATIGPDPNLIHPGQLLQAPSEEIP